MNRNIIIWSVVVALKILIILIILLCRRHRRNRNSGYVQTIQPVAPLPPGAVYPRQQPPAGYNYPANVVPIHTGQESTNPATAPGYVANLNPQPPNQFTYNYYQPTNASANTQNFVHDAPPRYEVAIKQESWSSGK